MFDKAKNSRIFDVLFNRSGFLLDDFSKFLVAPTRCPKLSECPVLVEACLFGKKHPFVFVEVWYGYGHGAVAKITILRIKRLVSGLQYLETVVQQIPVLVLATFNLNAKTRKLHILQITGEQLLQLAGIALEV